MGNAGLVTTVSRTVVGAWLLVTILFNSEAAHAREKIDVITLNNGDRITGEIKNLDTGILTVGTDHAGTISIEWIGVATVQSQQLFEIVESDGVQLVGTFASRSGGEISVVDSDGDHKIVQCKNIVRISQLGRTRWKRWRGSFNIGASFISANNQRDMSLDAEATYQNERFRLRNTLSGAISDRDDAERTSWGTVAANYQKYLKNKWFWYSQLQFDRNEELDLELRSTLSGGGGLYFLATVRSQFFVSVGISALQETYAPDNEGDWSSELAFTGDYELFLFQGRDTSLTSSLSFLPSLSVSDRYRVEYAASFRRKLVRDFTVSLNLNGSYDSMPPEGSKASDTSFTFNLGWSF